MSTIGGRAGSANGNHVLSNHMNYTSKSLPNPVAQQFERLQPEDMTVGEFTSVLLDAYEAETTTEPCGDVATSEDIERLSKQLEDIERQVGNVPRDTADYLR